MSVCVCVGRAPVEFMQNRGWVILARGKGPETQRRWEDCEMDPSKPFCGTEGLLNRVAIFAVFLLLSVSITIFLATDGFPLGEVRLEEEWQ